ncbi:hypothetical protein BWK58_13375, partial [Flavobacterium columnare]
QYNDQGDLIQKFVKPLKFKNGSYSPQIDFQTNHKNFHIIQNNPTLYREVWSFYYVFKSKKIGNMFFTKKKWWQ